MAVKSFIVGIICILVLLAIMFRLTHYAKFYAPSYLFWTGVILVIAGIISLIYPLRFLFIYNSAIAVIVLLFGAMVSSVSLLWPVKIKRSSSNLKLDGILQEYAFAEFHEVSVSAAPEITKKYFKITGINDIPAARLLMKIRGIAKDYEEVGPERETDVTPSGIVSTPDFDFFMVAPDEWIMVMILKSSMMAPGNKTSDPPEISSLEQFMAFDLTGYVKVAANFRFTEKPGGMTTLTTETRVAGNTFCDSRIFGYYWRIIYPGSAIIRRVWLNTIKKRSENEK
jgi:hypothetical protein